MYADGINCAIVVINMHKNAIASDTIHNPLLKYISLIFILSFPVTPALKQFCHNVLFFIYVLLYGGGE